MKRKSPKTVTYNDESPEPSAVSNEAAGLGRILVVDDEPELATVLVSALESQGFYATGLVSCREALEQLHHHNYDLLITDLMMPEMDGITLLQKALKIDPDIVGIFMTGQGTIETAVDAMKLGAFDYVLKPFRMQSLLPVLTRAINARRLLLENLQLRETVAIYSLSQTIAFTLEPQTILSRLADASLQQTDADEVSVLLPSPDGKEFYVAAVRGEKRERLLGERIPLGESIASWVARERTPIILNGEVHDERFVALWPRPEIRSSVSVPMQVANKLIGVINLNLTSKQRPFTLGQMKALMILASTAASALETASLYIQVRKAEEDYRSIFENSIEGIFRTRPDGKFIAANPAMAHMLGYDSPAELMSSVNNIVSDCYVDPAQHSNLERLLKEFGRVQAYEVECRRRDGKRVFLSKSSRLVRDKQGKILYYEGTAENITERKLAEAQQAHLNSLLESERSRLKNIVASIPGVVWEAWGKPDDTVGLRIDFVSDYVEQMLGYSVEEWLSTPNFWLTIIHPEDRDQTAKRAADSFAKRKAGSLRFRWLTRDGRALWVESHFVVVCDESGAPIGMRGVAIDVSEGKQAEDMQARRAAQSALRADVSAALAETGVALNITLQRCVEALVQNLGAAFARIWTLNSEEEMLELQASAGIYTNLDGSHSRVPVGLLRIGKIAEERIAHITNDLQNDPRLYDHEWPRRVGIISFAGYPLMVEDRVVGVMALFARHPLADDTLDALASVADIISQGIERKRVEEALSASESRLRQSQKLEAIGQLAGGVAHDFNNLLTVIGGYASILLGKLPPESSYRSSVEEIKTASDRASGLTRQLLAFSRKQLLQPKVLDLNTVVGELDKMVRRLIGEDIDVLSITFPELGKVKADPGQIEQVILNLIVNARDAMVEGGKLTIETSNANFTEDYARRHGINAGKYVMLAVSDTGAGMDAETQARIFEPFFTTKGAGKGTGLGLSTVYGIVKQSGGHIWVYSEVGKGTTFKIYLPRVDEAVDLNESSTKATVLRGNETVLLVEDEEQVRVILKEILEAQGYKVLLAFNGTEALKVAKEYKQEIHLLLTDVVMPQMSGRELAKTLLSSRPSMKILYMSGYTDDAIVRHGLLDERLSFIQKPFDAATVTRKTREVLDFEE